MSTGWSCRTVGEPILPTMTFRRHRRAFATLCLGAWLFALGIGMAYACGWDAAAHAMGSVATGYSATHDDGDDAPPGCDDVCKDQLTVVTKVQAVEDLPSGDGALAPPSEAASPHAARLLPVRAWFDPEPPPAVSISIRFLRLHL